MTIVDDARLEQLAARRPKDLLPVLERTTSLSPLLVVLTLVPGIVALTFASGNELDAQWRLKSLELSTVSSVFDAVDPSTASTQTALRWQPPLSSWLAAGALHLPWPMGSHGLDLADYLSAAALIPASFFVMSRLMGRRVGLLTALLAAFHTTFLQQHQHAAPDALAVVAALGAFWGFLGHLWRSDDLVSINLLIGGISLGLCLLAGGPLAFVVVAVLLACVAGPIEPPPDARRAAALRVRRRGSGWQAFRSTTFIILTAFAVGGWWELMMLYSYGIDFLNAWMSGIPAPPPFGAPLPRSLPMPPIAPVSIAVGPTPLPNLGAASAWSGTIALRLVQEFFATTGVLSGLTVLGLYVLGRRVLRPNGGLARANYLFLLFWTGCAALVFASGLHESVFAAGFREAGPGSLYSDMWRLFLVSACTGCSAVALDEVLQRRIGLALFAGVTIGTVFCGYLFLHAGGPRAAPSPWLLAGSLIVAVLAARLLRRYCAESELRLRMVLAALILAQLLADASLGMAAVRARDPGSEPLTLFRHSLPSGIDADVCVLICESEPPSRLKLAVKSTWPNAQFFAVRDWDETLKIAFGESQTPKSAVVVDWREGNSRPANPTGAQWEAEPIGNPQFFERRQLRAYVLVWE